MMREKKVLNGILDWLFEDRNTGKVVINNNNLLETITEDDDSGEKGDKDKTFKSLNFEFFFSFILSILVLIIIYAFTLINDYILFDTKLHVNEQGALNPQKALNCEYAMYLFNTSEPWANTGVRINNGDLFRINISGATNTTIKEILEASRDNIEPKHNWVFYDKPHSKKDIKQNENALELCISKGAYYLRDTVIFGSMLYTIQSEGKSVVYEPQSVDRSEIFKWETVKPNQGTYNPCRFQRAKKSGYLYLAVNDIVFGRHNESQSSNVIDEQISRYNNIMKDEGDPFPLDNKGITVLKQNGSYFYNDNLGQILVSVEIRRKIPFSFFSPPLNALREYEYGLSDTWQDKSQCVPLKLAKSIWKTIYLILVDAIYIILYSVICFVAVFILDRLLRALYFIFRWIKIICTSLFLEILH